MGSIGNWLKGILGARLTGSTSLAVDYERSAAPRLMFYCASNIGLGHMGRVVRVMRRLRSLSPDLNLLLVTDAKDLTLAQGEAPLAVAKLPSFEFDANGQYGERPQALGLSKRQLLGIRRNMLLGLARSYQPNLIYMDSLPHGKRDEMLPALRWARAHGAKTVLCMRDIPCAPGEKFKLSGDSSQIGKHLALYDQLLVASDRNFFDVGEEYGWPDWAGQKVRYVGFVVPQAADKPEKETPGEPRQIVASFGGGWEATELAREIFDALTVLSGQGLPDWRLSLFTGPAIPAEDYADLRERTRGDSRIHIEKLSADFPTLLAHADLAILQAGSTPFQILESDIAMLVYHRDYKIDEQACRARLLARHAGVELLDRSMLGKGAFAEKIRAALNGPRPCRQTGYDFAGVENTAQQLARLLEK